MTAVSSVGDLDCRDDKRLLKVNPPPGVSLIPSSVATVPTAVKRVPSPVNGF